MRELDYVIVSLAKVAESSSDKSASFDQLAEEVLELHLSYRGKHHDTPAMELIEVATIAMNMLRNRPPAEIATAFTDWFTRHGDSRKDTD